MKNPFDADFKTFAEDHPELLLRLLGIVAPDTKLQVINILRELRLDTVHIDHAYVLDETEVVHFEAITSWNATRIGLLALYHFLLKHRFRKPVTPVPAPVSRVERESSHELPST